MLGLDKELFTGLLVEEDESCNPANVDPLTIDVEGTKRDSEVC